MKRKRDHFAQLPAVPLGTVNAFAASLGLDLPTRPPRKEKPEREAAPLNEKRVSTTTEQRGAHRSVEQKSQGQQSKRKDRKDEPAKKASTKKDSQRDPKEASAKQKESTPIRDSKQEEGNANGKSKLTALQSKMKAKLKGARFRWINEQLYTTEGEQAFAIIKEQPELFSLVLLQRLYKTKTWTDGNEKQYHEGFREQAASWPENPLDLFIARIKAKRPASMKGKTPLQVADMGCGDARLAKTLDDGSGCEHVSSFDLAKNGNPYITRACSMQDTQLPDSSMDVVIFCLSLMGTDWIAFVEEAVRILKKSKEAEVWVAEVKSRFETTERAKFTELDSFIKACEACGLRLIEQEDKNKMFILFRFAVQSSNRQVLEEEVQPLKPCIYKRR